MSVNGSVFFVDWDAVLEQWRDEPAAFWQDDFLYQEEYDAEFDGWHPRFQRESYDLPEWIENYSWACEAAEFYRLLRKDLSKPDRVAWDRFFSMFMNTPKSHDLPKFQQTSGADGVADIFSPATLARMVADYRQLDVEQLRPPFAAQCRPEPRDYLKNFAEFASYLQQWFAAVEAAQRSGKAMVLWIA